jgi:hypothetical protein
VGVGVGQVLQSFFLNDPFNEKLKHSLFVASSLAMKMSLHFPEINHIYHDVRCIQNCLLKNIFMGFN